MAGIICDLTYIARCGNRYRTQQLEKLGLTAGQASSLLAICKEPGLTQDQLAYRVVLNKSNITRQIATLEEAGFVRRCPSPTDKRSIQLFPTEKTLEILPQIRQVSRQWREDLLQDMTPEEQEQLEVLLQRIKGRAAQWIEVHLYD